MPGCVSSTASWPGRTTSLGFEHELEGKVRDQLVSSQREQILRTQIRVLQNELGETDDDDEIETYRQKIVALELDEDTGKAPAQRGEQAGQAALRQCRGVL